MQFLSVQFRFRDAGKANPFLLRECQMEFPNISLPWLSTQCASREILHPMAISTASNVHWVHFSIEQNQQDHVFLPELRARDCRQSSRQFSSQTIFRSHSLLHISSHQNIL